MDPPRGRRWTRRPSRAGAQSPAPAWPWGDRHFPGKVPVTRGGKSGVVPAHSGSEISLRDVSGPPAPGAAIVPVPSAAAARPSFDAVYRNHAKTVARWASRLLGPGGDCEDVVQDVFIVVRK